MAAAKTDHTLERLVFFSDAVFAIAITLLVIEIQVPHLPRTSSDAEHWQALSALVPSFAGFMISFALVGAFWMSHHRTFALTAHYHPRVLGWNMGLLAIIAFMPFSTAYFSANIEQRVPTLAYCATLLVASLLNAIVNRIATAPPMVAESAAPETVAAVRRRSAGMVLGSGTALALTLSVPGIGIWGLFAIPVWRLVLMRVSAWRARGAALKAGDKA